MYESIQPVISLWSIVISIWNFFKGHVVMGNNAVSPYQQVIEKTKSLSFRSQMLAMNIEKKLNQGSRAEVSRSFSVFLKQY